MKIRALILLWTAIAFVLVACAESVTPVSAPHRVNAGATTQDLLGLSILSCTPITADSVTQSIGPTGGTIHVGPHSFIVPPGALDSTVSITAVAPSDTINRVRFWPEGLTFSPQASLVLSYANCGTLGFLPLRRVVYVDSTLSLLDLLPSLDDFLNKRVTGKVSHFSDYVVAW